MAVRDPVGSRLLLSPSIGSDKEQGARLGNRVGLHGDDKVVEISVTSACYIFREYDELLRPRVFLDT